MRLFTKSTRKGTGLLVLFAGASALLSADTLTLRSGEVIRGTFLGGTARQVRMEMSGETRTYDLTDVTSITFTDQSAQAPAPRYSPSSNVGSGTVSNGGAPRLRRAPGSEAPTSADTAPARYGSMGITLPVDTSIVIRMIDTVDSERSRTGQTFRASLDEPIVVDGREVIPRGADVLTKLVDQQESGKIQGKATLTLALSTITVDGQPRDITTTDVSESSSSRGSRSAKVIGGTAALGAIIGAIAGGGKGAAIGAGSGAAVGTGAEVLTGGQKVRIPSETRLTFRLQNPVQL